jgi:RNA polymerase sigma-70 factor (ECF subfamily)
LQQSEKALIQGLIKGDETVFRELFERHYSSMYSIARAIVGETIADEVIQEAWMSALKALPNFEGRSSFKVWLMRITSNEAKTRFRKESRNVSLESMQEDWATDPRFDQNSHWVRPSSQWDGETPEALFEVKELRDCINKNMDKLPDNQRIALYMRGTGGLSMDELCNLLEVSPSNVRVLLHRARDKILQVIERFQQTGEC